MSRENFAACIDINMLRSRRGLAKIDPVIATLNGASLMSRNPQAPKKVDIDGFLNNPILVGV